jgi:hypothetical protein
MKFIFLRLLLFLGFISVYSQSDIEKVNATVSKNKIEGHIYYLADDLLKGRETGTPENDIAASYLANTLRSYGVKPNPQNGTYYQSVDLEKVSPDTNFFLSINDKEYKYKVALKIKQVKANALAEYVGYGLEDDYKGTNLYEKYAIVKAGGPDTKDARGAFQLRKKKEELAQRAGAIGIIEFIQTDSKTWSYIEQSFNGDRIELADPSRNKEDKHQLTHIWVYDEFGTKVLDLSKEESLNLKIALGGEKRTPVKSRNVIGMVEGTDPGLKDEYIVYSAHYDHVGIGSPDDTGDKIYNGARDNAVGTTTVLSMAENIAAYPTKRSALFILFTAEEEGLLGSKYYINNPVVPLHQVVFCFNSDNGGYNDTTLATIIGLDRTTAASNIKRAVSESGLIASDDPAPELNIFERSDNIHFARKGIPSPSFTMGFSSYDDEIKKYYHRPGDEADTLDYDYLLKFFRSYVLSGRYIANDPSTQLWVSGDKFEEIVKELYKR